MTTINTIAPTDECKYVRIFPCSITPSGFSAHNLNRVAQVSALPTAKEGELGYGLIFIIIDNEDKVLDVKDTEFITEKEYFAGVLKYG